MDKKPPRKKEKPDKKAEFKRMLSASVPQRPCQNSDQ